MENNKEQTNSYSGNSETVAGNSSVSTGAGSSTGTYAYNPWSSPERVEVNEYPDRIEMVYKQTSMITYTVYPTSSPDTRVFKIIFSCVDGKWNKSEPIFGKIVPRQQEYYEFED